MHEFLKTVGFSDLKSKKDLDAILRDVLDNYDTKKIVENEKHHSFGGTEQKETAIMQH